MIRFANKADIDDIIKFIDEHWKKDHILSRDKEFFLYQYELNNDVNFVISRNADTDEIEGVLGYIPYSEHDVSNRDVMLALWKVIKTPNPTLGIELISFLKDNGNIKIMACTGINKKTRGVYAYLGNEVGLMTHWYRLGKNSDFKIALVKDNEIPNIQKNDTTYKKYDNWNDLLKDFDFNKYYENNPKPLKEDRYVRRRYFDHPVYNYEVYGHINNLGKAETLFVFRKENYEDECCIRFIDCIGNLENIKYVTGFIDILLEQSNAEYIDLYECGLNDDVLQNAGWKKTTDTENIIPNYFAPFEQKNVDIYYFTSDKDIVLFKGDGDQDRPN